MAQIKVDHKALNQMWRKMDSFKYELEKRSKEMVRYADGELRKDWDDPQYERFASDLKTMGEDIRRKCDQLEKDITYLRRLEKSAEQHSQIRKT